MLLPRLLLLLGASAVILCAAAVYLLVTQKASATLSSAEGFKFGGISASDAMFAGFWVFVWVAALLALYLCLLSVFSDSSTSGWGKALWVLLLVFLPWLGVLIYLSSRRSDIEEAQLTAARRAHAQQEAYIRAVAAFAASPAEQITHAKALLDAGAIAQAEFDALKSKARTQG